MNYKHIKNKEKELKDSLKHQHIMKMNQLFIKNVIYLFQLHSNKQSIEIMLLNLIVESLQKLQMDQQH